MGGDVSFLQEGMQFFGINFAYADSLKKYVELLLKWNKTYNLISANSVKTIYPTHVFDCLAIAPFCKNFENILDVGTGAGFPGMILAIVFPEKQFTLVDSNFKKIRFLNYVIADLGLKNVRTFHDRVENISGSFDLIVTRALADLETLLFLTRNLYAKNGHLLAMKSQKVDEEITVIREKFLAKNIVVHDITVPFLAAQRKVVILEPITYHP